MADMFSLLLTFFVLLLSFANMDVVKFRMMLGSVQDALGVQTQHPGTIMARATSPVEFSAQESTPHIDAFQQTQPSPSPSEEGMMDEMQRIVGNLDLGNMVEVESVARGVVVRVKGQLLFDSGSAKLRAESFVFLDEIARLSNAFPNPISIEGHTDDLPITSSEFPTNWNLSADRAISALRHFAESGGVDRGRLVAAGYADTQPLVPNDSPDARARNRRVEFVYLRPPSFD